MIKKTCFYLLLLLLFSQCIPVQEEIITEVTIDLKDPVLRQIFDFQDQRNTDSLYNWIRHKNPAYRYATAMAFASVQDNKALDSLAVLLKDDVEKVRITAAYAIGQLRDEIAEPVLVNAFQKHDSLAASDQYNRAILEGVGKCASPNFLKSLATISTYTKTDTALLEGQALGIYRYALRNFTIPEGTQKMVDFLEDSDYPESVKIIAANYLARGQNLQLDSSIAAPLIIAYNQNSNPNIQMALAIALGKTKDQDARAILAREIRENTDYRVKCNVIRAFGNFEYNEIQEYVLESLSDKNIHVASSAAQFLVNHGISSSARSYRTIAKDTTLNWQVRTALYRAANKHLPYYEEATKGRINQELRNRFQSAVNPYEKAAILVALSESSWNYRFINEQRLLATNPIERTATMEALAYIANKPDFDRFFGIGKRSVKRDLGGYFVDAINSGDPALVAIAAGVISKPELDFKAIIDSTAFLDQALAKLSLPKEFETYNALQKAIDYFKGSASVKKEIPDFNHPIDWLVIESLEEGAKVIVQTQKGNIVLEMLTELAPGSVSNFIQLAKNGFFDGKSIHRVVPNFVVQTGCTRGDGWGLLDYSIRTEVPMVYYDQEGYVGMASIGKDTECTQWFITHSPTPHLDGKYTIFAKVVDGMDAVHKITIGDKIEKVTITK